MLTPFRKIFTAAASAAAFAICSTGQAAEYFVNAASGNDTGSGLSVKEAFKTLKKAHNSSNPGDIVNVMAGHFDERVVFTRGGREGCPVLWRTYGDGDVQWTFSGPVPAYTGAMLYADGITGPSHVVFEGRPGSRWVFYGAGKGDGALCLYGNISGTRTTDWRFSHIVIRDNRTRAATITPWRLIFEDSEVSGNGHGIMLLPVDSNRDAANRPWSGSVIRRNRFFNNGSPNKNTDGITVQDIDGVLIEDNEVSGQYDGIDCGSLPGAALNAPGPRWIIVRSNMVTGHNGCTPCSTVRQGPLFIGYNSIYDNQNWGATPVYEESGNVHIWNNTYVNNRRAVNFIDPTGTIHFFNNLVAGRAGFTIALDANHHLRQLGCNYLAGASHANPSGAAPDDQSGATNSVIFADKSRLYPITPENPALIDHGTFFIRTAAAIENSVTIPTAPSYPDGPADPRTFFWVGDQIQIAGAGRHRIVSISASSITVDTPLTAPAGTGIHYPYYGAAPDIGRSELKQ